MLRIRLLGQFRVELDGTRVVIPARVAQSLFALLALRRGQSVGREHLIDLLWPDLSPERGHRRLRQALWRIHHALENGNARADKIIFADEYTVEFNAAIEHWIDTYEFARGDLRGETAEELMTRAALYQGELLPGFYDEWVESEREHFAAAYESVMSTLLKKLVAQKKWHCAIEWSEQWIALAKTPEPAYCALMQAYYALGDYAKIESTFERCRAALDELGVAPAPATRALYTRLSQNKAPRPPPLRK